MSILGGTATIGAALLRRRDPIGLALAAQVGLELGKPTEHVEERLAGSGRGVHRLFGGSEMGAFVLQRRDNDLKITHQARQAVDARDHQRFPGWMKSRMVPSSGCPARVAPVPVSVRIMVQPAASSAAIWTSRFWSLVETLA
jgi:hypothetical protein